MRDGRKFLRAALLCACVPVAALADEQGTSSGSVFFTGVEIDNQDSHRLDLGMALESSRGTRFDLLLRSLSMDVTVGASESDLLESTVFAGVKLTGSFGL